MSYGQYLFCRSGTYYFRRKFTPFKDLLTGGFKNSISPDFQEKSIIEIKKSLKTKNIKIARTHVRRFNVFLDELMNQVWTTYEGQDYTPETLLSIRRVICDALDRVMSDQIGLWEIERALSGQRSIEQAQQIMAHKTSELMNITSELATNNFERVSRFVETALSQISLDVNSKKVAERIAGREALIKFQKLVSEDLDKELGGYLSRSEPTNICRSANITPIATNTPSLENSKKAVPSPLFSEVHIEYIQRRQNGEKIGHKDAPLSDDGRRFKNAVELWVSINGDLPICNYDDSHAENFKQMLDKIPANYNKSENDRENQVSLQDFISIADHFDEQLKTEITEAVANGEIPESEGEFRLLDMETKRLGRNTVNKHISSISKIFEYYENLTNSTTIRKKVVSFRYTESEVDNDPKKFTRGMSDEQLYKFMTAPVFTGVKSRKEFYLSGKKALMNEGLFWIPVLNLFMGLRREEASQLKIGDIQVREGEHVINIRAGLGQTLKNETSARIIPIPKILIKLGFIEFYRVQKEKGCTYLFPELSIGKSGCRGDIIGDQILRLRQEIGLAERGCDLHALRHAFCTEALQKGGFFEVMYLMGHSINAVTTKTYNHKKPTIKELKKVMDKIGHGFEVIKTELGPILRPRNSRMKNIDLELPEILK